MKLNIYKFLVFAISALLFAACSKTSAPSNPVEYARACDAANENKVVTVQGFLNAAPTTPCQKNLATATRDCSFRLLDKINVAGEFIIVNLPEGKAANQVETPETGAANLKPTGLFARENLKIRLNDGTEIVPQENVATPMTVTGTIRLTDKSEGGKICSLTASRVEKR